MITTAVMYFCALCLAIILAVFYKMGLLKKLRGRSKIRQTHECYIVWNFDSSRLGKRGAEASRGVVRTISKELLQSLQMPNSLKPRKVGGGFLAQQGSNSTLINELLSAKKSGTSWEHLLTLDRENELKKSGTSLIE